MIGLNSNITSLKFYPNLVQNNSNLVQYLEIRVKIIDCFNQILKQILNGRGAKFVPKKSNLSNPVWKSKLGLNPNISSLKNWPQTVKFFFKFGSISQNWYKIQIFLCSKFPCKSKSILDTLKRLFKIQSHFFVG